MSRVGWFIALLVFIMIASPARAVAPDLSTPKKAAVQFAKALEAGDTAAMKRTCVGSDQDFELAEVIGGLVRSARKLRDTATAKFGQSGQNIFPNASDLADFDKRMDACTEKLDGDTATVGQPGQQQPLKLKKAADGNWKVDLSSIADKDEINQMLPKVQKVLENAAADIKAGKFKTVEQAKDAVSEQWFTAIAQSPATQPAAEH